MVFDEIDAGIGGQTAHAVGETLRRLAGRAQVITITHLPQIASLADRHFRVEKVPGDPTHTRIEPLDADERREELERMLGGADFLATLASGWRSARSRKLGFLPSRHLRTGGRGRSVEPDRREARGAPDPAPPAVGLTRGARPVVRSTGRLATLRRLRTSALHAEHAPSVRRSHDGATASDGVERATLIGRESSRVSRRWQVEAWPRERPRSTSSSPAASSRRSARASPPPRSAGC